MHKYIYGPRVDEPVCMIDVADSNAVYYYHFDGLGSVVALSDSDGDSVQTYEYSVYGQVAAEDPNHTNPYMFTGRRFDFETGLYYYRARYYNPYIGRFLQTDPVGYGYGYCGNNPVGRVDPSGLYWTFLDSLDTDAGNGYIETYFPQYMGKLVFAWVDDSDFNLMEPNPDNVDILWDGYTLEGKSGWYYWAENIYFPKVEGWVMVEQVGYELSRTWKGYRGHNQDWFFWRLQAMRFLSSYVENAIAAIEGLIGPESSRKVVIQENKAIDNKYIITGDTVTVNWYTRDFGHGGERIPGLESLTHDLVHAHDFLEDGQMLPYPAEQNRAIALENQMRLAFYWKVPGWRHLWPLRPYE